MSIPAGHRSWLREKPYDDKPFAGSMVGISATEAKAKIASLSLLEADEETFELASGRRSKWFCDLKPSMMDPELSSWIGISLLEVSKGLNANLVGGLEMGAVPLAALVVSKADPAGPKGFMIRKKPKGRGGRKTGNPTGIEGTSIQGNERVLILEDVTTTGDSSLLAAQRMRNETSCDVIGIITVVDREEGGRSRIENNGFQFFSLMTLNDLIHINEDG